jgi:hypothetical protein
LLRLVVQSHRQTGLSTVYTDLLDFAGNEIYLRAEPRLAGRPFGDALHAYRLGCPIGIRRPDGTVVLNPPSDTPVAATDQMIVLAEDDTLIQLTHTAPTIMAEAVVTVAHREATPDRTLLIGWNSRGPKILDLLDELAPPGSVAEVAVPMPPDGVLRQPRRNLAVAHRPCEPTNRRSLEGLDLAATSTWSCWLTTVWTRTRPTTVPCSPCCTCATSRPATATRKRSSPRSTTTPTGRSLRSPRPTTSS